MYPREGSSAPHAPRPCLSVCYNHSGAGDSSIQQDGQSSLFRLNTAFPPQEEHRLKEVNSQVTTRARNRNSMMPPLDSSVRRKIPRSSRRSVQVRKISAVEPVDTASRWEGGWQLRNRRERGVISFLIHQRNILQGMKKPAVVNIEKCTGCETWRSHLRRVCPFFGHHVDGKQK